MPCILTLRTVNIINVANQSQQYKIDTVLYLKYLIKKKKINEMF